VLLPYILQGHRMWRESKLRIFAIAPENLVNQLQTERKLKSYLDNLRIKAEIKVVPISIDDVKDIDQNRTVVIRNGLATPTGHSSVLSADLFRPSTNDSPDHAQDDAGKNNVQDDQGTSTPSRLRRSGSSFLQSIRPGSRRGSLSQRENEDELEERLQKTVAALENKNLSESVKVWTNDFSRRNSLGVIFETPSSGSTNASSAIGTSQENINKYGENSKESKKGRKVTFENPDNSKNDRDALRKKKALMRLDKRLKTAKRINEKIRAASSRAALVVLNLPLSRKTPGDEFIEYTETLTKDLSRVIMIRGNGDENVENFSVV